MFRLIMRTIMARRLRTALLVLGVLVVSGAFGVLLATVETTRLTVDEDLARYWRTTYDILVRPPDSVSPIEQEHGLVQANHLSQLPGGITLKQYQAIAEMPGVEVAAPIAMLGFFELVFHSPLDVSCEPGFYRLQNATLIDDGVRRYRVVGEEFFACAKNGGEFTHLFDSPYYNWLALTFTDTDRPSEAPWWKRAVFRLPVLLAAVDPEQESRLLDLDQSIVDGEYLHDIESPPSGAERVVVKAGDAGAPSASGGSGDIPLILNARSYVSFTLQTEWQRIDLPFSQESLGQVVNEEEPTQLASLSSETLARWTFDGQQSYRSALDALRDDDSRVKVNALRALPTGLSYREIPPPPGAEGPALEAIPLGVGWPTGGSSIVSMPVVAFDLEMRFRETGAGTGLGGDLPFLLQGIYDIEHLPRPPAVSQVPLETYFAPAVTLRYDDAGRPVPPVLLGPTFSDVGYITSPPLALTTLESGAWLSFQRESPISAIRVRVAQVDEFTPEAQSRVETVAAGIIERTGLAVDITVGSSPRRVLVRIPGKGPIPAVGYVEEGWVQKGLSYTLVRETKRFNVLLFSVMLVVSAVHILNTSLISTLARRREIALHKALGWRTGSVFALVLSEGLLVGLVAGALGLALALAVTALFRLDMPLEKALVILPLGVVLCLVGSLVPAVVASRIPPAQALRQGEISVTRVPFGRLSLPGYAWRQALRRRARAVLAVLTIAISAGLVVLFLGVIWYAHGYLYGTLLGEQLLLHIQGYHFIIAAVSFVVAGIATADVLLMGVAERRREIGVLKAVGWRDRHVFRLFLWDAAGLAIAGGLLGWGMGALAYWSVYREIPLTIPALLVPALVLALLVSLLAAVYPAWQAAQVPPAEAMRYE
jgi:cell division protein FtsX